MEPSPSPSENTHISNNYITITHSVSPTEHLVQINLGHNDLQIWNQGNPGDSSPELERPFMDEVLIITLLSKPRFIQSVWSSMINVLTEKHLTGNVQAKRCSLNFLCTQLYNRRYLSCHTALFPSMAWHAILKRGTIFLSGAGKQFWPDAFSCPK